MLDPVIVEKGEIIERCIRRAREEHASAGDFAKDYGHQDAAILNLQRACEAAIDIGARWVMLRRFGHASETRQIFEKLSRAGVIDAALGERLIGMVGFRNVVVHSYREIDIDLVEDVIAADVNDLFIFANLALRETATAD